MGKNTPQDSLIGKMLGAYHIQSRLGEGGMARVYKAYHGRLRRDVAIKVIAADIANDPEFQARFEREAQVIASLEHHNIVAVYDFFSDAEGLTYLVMQYVGGGTLRDQLRSGQPLEARRAARYALQMARALHHAHQRGIVHRDVKPQNMLVSASNPDQLLLSDFGIAKLFDKEFDTVITGSQPASQISGPPASSTLTGAGQMIGTAEYMAPEQILKKPVDARTDVYALGVVLYQMLTGSTPFKSESLYGLLVQHVQAQPTPVCTINPAVPESLALIAEKALAKAPGARFQSAEEMAQALESALQPGTDPLHMPSFSSFPTLSPPSTPQFPSYSSEVTLRSSHSSPSGPAAPFPTTRPTHPPLPTTSPHEHARYPDTLVTGTSLRPAQKRQIRPFSLYTLASAAIIIFVVFLLTQRVLPLLNQGSSLSNNAIPPASSFSETFENNNRHWPLSGPGMQASIESKTYTLLINDNNSYFPHPDAKITGTLPKNFTLAADIQLLTSAQNTFYGLVFRYHEDRPGAVSSYVFLVDAQGDYRFAKYSAGQQAALGEGTFIGGKPGRLQVSVHDNTFSFQINGQDIPINPARAPATSISDTDHPFTGGLPGIFVAGAGTRIAVTRIQLTVEA
ncbi:MAG: protein kinase [Ktedonobacteraceae bacterium]|nr:protein kinase [Ktedonobacteraceae bacterium]